MSVQDEVDERRRTEAVGHSTNTSDPVQDHACIQAAWQAAAPLWPAWFEVLEAEEATPGGRSGTTPPSRSRPSR
jgi:hypothetical protein